VQAIDGGRDRDGEVMAAMQSFDQDVIMDREQVRAFDAWAIRELGLPGVVLMENAGRACAEALLARLDDPGAARVVVLCGPGNNGGDGYVIARHLAGAGVTTETILCGDRDRVRGDALVNLQVLERMGLPVRVWAPTEGYVQTVRETLAPVDGAEQPGATDDSDAGGDSDAGNQGPMSIEAIREALARADWVVDALFGTGLRNAVRRSHATVIEAIHAAGRPVLAVDIPSGLDCDTGEPLGLAVRATLTVTFVAVKKGFNRPESRDYTGDVEVASIGITPAFGPAVI